MIVQAEAGEFGDTKLFAKDALAVVALESPVFEAGLDAARAFEKRSLGGFEKLFRAGKQSFAGSAKLEFIAKSFVGARARKFCGLKFTSGEIDECEANRRARWMAGDRSKKIVLANVEDSEVRGSTGSDDAYDFAANEFLPGSGLLHLVANGDFEPGAN